MTRDESKIMQGVAILMMIFFHLPHNVETEFESVLTNFSLANNPVPLYTLLSGYGFYKVYERKQKDKHHVSRCLRLYSVYWITMTVFLLIGELGGYSPEVNIQSILKNYTGWQSTFYLPSWFVLPYVALALVYPLIMKTVDRHKAVATLGVAYAVYIVMAYLTRYPFFQQNFLQVFYIFFPFVLGAVMAKYNVVEWFKSRCHNGWLPWLLLVALIVIRYFVKTGAVLAFYSGAIAILVAAAYKPKWLSKTLHEFGRVNVDDSWLADMVYLARRFLFTALSSVDIPCCRCSKLCPRARLRFCNEAADEENILVKICFIYRFRLPLHDR